MNWDYISGFFDADGSVTAAVVSKGGNRTIQISFHNNEFSILQEIQEFILRDIGVKGSISQKTKTKLNHNTAYDLVYTYKRGLSVANKMTVFHPKKKHRIRLYNLIQNATKRNGKYTEEEKEERDELVKMFFEN